MSELANNLAMLKQMRWRDAHLATGGLNDRTTDNLIRIHQAIVAMEAAAAEGEPEQLWNVDIDGWPLNDAGKGQATSSISFSGDDDDNDVPTGSDGRSSTTGY